MRKILLSLFVNFALLSQAYNLGSVTDAIQYLESGNVSDAVAQLKKSAAVNDMVAQFYMGQCYEYGIGVEKDPKQAFMMYRRAAERGFAPAMQMLSRCYGDGIGVDMNQARADDWLSRYYKRNDGTSIPDIAAIYANANVASESSHQPAAPSGNRNKTVREKSATSPKTKKRPESSVAPSNNHQPVLSASAPKSDVDIDIPRSAGDRANVFALIIANEDYQDVATVPNALNDGEVVAKYCNLTLGLPQTNIHLIKNATLNNIKREINIMKKIAEAYKGEASFIVYYAGHGIPDESTRDAFLLPVDGYIADVTTCYKLSDFYAALGDMAARKTIVMLDACFSGASRDGGMLASARGVAIKSKPAAPAGNMLVISSATGDETAYPYEEQNHGLFTYFLLKKLKESHGKVTLGSLVDFVSDNVAKKSIVINGKSQTPTVVPSQSLDNNWKNWTLY